jgi:transposase
MFSYLTAEERVLQDHSLRAIRTLVDEILREMTREFDALYGAHGRPSIPPERLLRAESLQLFYSIRSERLLMEQLDYDILFRRFVGLEMDEPIWVPTVFTKKRDRLLQHAVAHSFFQRVVARAADLMSDEHFTVDGTLLEAGRVRRVFSGKTATPTAMDATSAGRPGRTTRIPRGTYPGARLYRKSNQAEARLAYLRHLLMGNRHGLIVDAQATVADGLAERAVASTMLSAHWRCVPPLGAARSGPTKPMTRPIASRRCVRCAIRASGGLLSERRLAYFPSGAPSRDSARPSTRSAPHNN